MKKLHKTGLMCNKYPNLSKIRVIKDILTWFAKICIHKLKKVKKITFLAKYLREWKLIPKFATDLRNHPNGHKQTPKASDTRN